MWLCYLASGHILDTQVKVGAELSTDHKGDTLIFTGRGGGNVWLNNRGQCPLPPLLTWPFKTASVRSQVSVMMGSSKPNIG